MNLRALVQVSSWFSWIFTLSSPFESPILSLLILYGSLKWTSRDSTWSLNCCRPEIRTGIVAKSADEQPHRHVHVTPEN